MVGLNVRRIPTWVLALVLGIAALLPRSLTLNDFFTEDESFHWVWRVQHFAGALRQHHWVDTNLTGHPGVTTMWLGTLGRWLALALNVSTAGMAEGSAGIEYLGLLRLPLALVNSLAVVAGYLLLRRLVRSETALLAGVFWALSPFLVAHSRLLHVDGLLTSFMTLSILLVLVAVVESNAEGKEQDVTEGTRKQGGVGWLALAASGAMAGLAFLTKAPSLVLLPTVGLLLCIPLLEHRPGVHRQLGIVNRLIQVAASYVLWLTCAVLVVLTVWPAMWVSPPQAFGSVIDEILSNGGMPHHTGNFFLGRPVADPGWLFYPFVVLWRSTPVMLIGLLLLFLRYRPLAFRSQATPLNSLALPGSGEQEKRASHQAEQTALLALGLFVVFFTLTLSLSPKKFDRYLLPTWPTLEVLAAAGWTGVLKANSKQQTANGKRKPHLLRLPSMNHCATQPLVLSALCFLLCAFLFWYHPYYLAYFNPLLGGGTTAQRVMLVGWGEGMEKVGAWLRSRPDLTRSPVLSWDPRTLEPFIPVRTLFLTSQSAQEPASYAVLYSRTMQRREAAAAQDYVSQSPPLYTLHMYGIEYARVYQPPRPYNEPLDAIFGTGLHLKGFSQEMIGSTLVITPSWGIAVDQPGGWFCFVHVLSGDGKRVGQVDVPLDEGLFPNWQAGQQFGGALPIGLPSDLPTGHYYVVLGVYDPQSGQRLSLSQGIPAPEKLAGADVLQLTTFQNISRDD